LKASPTANDSLRHCCSKTIAAAASITAARVGVPAGTPAAGCTVCRRTQLALDVLPTLTTDVLIARG